MKIIYRVVVPAVCLLLIFFFREELSGLVTPIPANSIDNAHWSGLRKQAQDAYEFDDTQVAIDKLSEYLIVVSDEFTDHQNEREGLVTTFHDIICELSVLHSRLSQKYYQMSNEDLYYHHLVLHREFLVKCTGETDDRDS